MTLETELTELDFLTVQQIADICHYKGTEPVKRAIKRGELPGINLSHYQILVPKAAFVKWLSRHQLGDDHKADTLLKPTRAPRRALKAIDVQRRREKRKAVKSDVR